MTTTILAVTLVASVICFQRRDLMDKWMFNPYKIRRRNEWYRFLTSGFIHADWVHILVNMFVFYSFGQAVESYYRDIFGDGWRNYFLLLYFGGMAASVLPTYSQQKENPEYNALGASGAISAVVFAFILFRPFAKIYLFAALPMPAVVYGGLYLVYCYYAARRSDDHINHDAHFWGALYGVCITLLLKPALLPYFIDQIRG